MAAVSFTVWLLRDLVIWLLLSGNSAPCATCLLAADGDVFKVGAYVFGYLVIAKASLRFYLLCEISQFILLTLLSRILIPLHGALGAAQAYMATYIIYFLLCGSVFWIYRNRA
ncbi:hypothetical protein O0544_07310 [Edwardsiella anguillarum]|nr:hypothetical protein [Edwardsiella anguillarum]